MAVKKKVAAQKTNGHINRIDSVVPKKPPKVEAKVNILPIEIGRFNVPIKCLSPLIQHQFGEKARKQITDKQAGKAKQKTVRDPKGDYNSCFYMISGKPGTKRAKYGIPCAAFHQAMVSACRFVDGLPMTIARGAFFVVGTDCRNLATITSETGPRMEDGVPVRLAGPGSPLDLRYRPVWDDWSTVITIEHDVTVISADQIVNLANKAGFSVGIQEWRPERNGQYGRFYVDQTKLRIV